MGIDVAVDDQLAGHHDLYDEVLTRGQFENKGLTAPAHSLDFIPLQTAHEILDRLAQNPWINHVDPADGFLPDAALKVPADDFNFGEFGHYCLNAQGMKF